MLTFLKQLFSMKSINCCSMLLYCLKRFLMVTIFTIVPLIKRVNDCATFRMKSFNCCCLALRFLLVTIFTIVPLIKRVNDCATFCMKSFNCCCLALRFLFVTIFTIVHLIKRVMTIFSPLFRLYLMHVADMAHRSKMKR
jgi:hypothetical protein